MAVAQTMVVAPMQGANEVDAVGAVSRDSVARQLFDSHVAGLRARRRRDLISEKLLLHVDGSGDFQWMDILNDARVAIPRLISEWRKSENLLRLVVDNAVAHHTTMPLRYFAESGPDRRARDTAIVDTVWINWLAYHQDFNALAAEALYLAMPCGFCPIHAYWRDGTTHSYEPVSYGDVEVGGPGIGYEPTQGMIDCFVGNPFGTVYDLGARRGSVRWCSYERTLPADVVRETWGHLPGVMNLEGTSRVNSASEFQRIAQSWMTDDVSMHGSPVLMDRRDSDEELMTLVCRETAPGQTSDYPNGRLQIIAVPGHVDTRLGRGKTGHAKLLADQALPGNDYSWENVYSHHRGSDIHGKPWVEDLDQLQVDLNIMLSKHWEVLNRMIEAPIVAPGGAIGEDMADLDGYALLEIEPSLAAWRPRVMEWPQGILPALEKKIDDKRNALFTAGGYQASSRGEAPGSRIAYRAIVALQQADNTVHGPVNVRYQRSMTNFAQKCWRQMKTYGDVPWLINITGDQLSYLVEPYISGAQLSDEPPHYKLVNSFGSSPELRAQEVLELMQLRGADGEPFLLTAEARRQYPNPMVFDDEGFPDAVKRRRARTVAKAIIGLARQLREQTGMAETDPAHPWVAQAAQQVFYEAERRFPRKRDDLLEAHISTLSEITQDETADPIARQAAEARQSLYYEWQAAMAMQGAVATPGRPGAPGGTQVTRGAMSPAAIGAEAQGGESTMGDERGGGPTIAATAR